MARQYAVSGGVFAAYLNDTGTRVERLSDSFINETTSTSVTVSPGVGSILFTGYAPTVVSNTAVAPGVGSVVFTGFAPSITSDTVVAPGVGAIVFTGAAPTLDITVAPGVGAMTLTGFAPSPVALAPGGPMFSVIV